jgi:hypothetical protein
MRKYKRINIPIKFLGYGNALTASIIFIAIEENSPFISLKDYRNWCSKRKKIINLYYQNNPVNTAPGTEEEQTRLAYKIRRDIYRENIGTEEGYLIFNNNIEYKEFCSNLYPLGCNRDLAPYPKQYKEIFGIMNSQTEKVKFRNRILNKRIYLLNKFIKYKLKQKPNDIYFFIMGKEVGSELKNTFEKLGFIFPSELSFPRLDANNNYIEEDIVINPRSQLPIKWRGSSCGRVWLTRHPSNGWFNQEVATRIVNKIIEINECSL